MYRAHGTCGAASAGGVRTQTPGAAGGSVIVVPALRPSFARSARMPAATSSPTAMPLAFSSPSGIAASDA